MIFIQPSDNDVDRTQPTGRERHANESWQEAIKGDTSQSCTRESSLQAAAHSAMTNQQKSTSQRSVLTNRSIGARRDSVASRTDQTSSGKGCDRGSRVKASGPSNLRSLLTSIKDLWSYSPCSGDQTIPGRRPLACSYITSSCASPRMLRNIGASVEF